MGDMTGIPPANHEELLAAFLADRDEPCPVCRYNVKALETSVCPECGSRLELQLSSPDLLLGPWTVALLGAALPAGFYTVITLVTVWLSITTGPPSRREMPWLYAFYALTLMTITSCLVVIARRRRFLRLHKDRQWAIALAVSSLCVGSVIVYMALFVADKF
jgi:hypothetical protein